MYLEKGRNTCAAFTFRRNIRKQKQPLCPPRHVTAGRAQVGYACHVPRMPGFHLHGNLSPSAVFYRNWKRIPASWPSEHKSPALCGRPAWRARGVRGHTALRKPPEASNCCSPPVHLRDLLKPNPTEGGELNVRFLTWCWIMSCHDLF